MLGEEEFTSYSFSVNCTFSWYGPRMSQPNKRNATYRTPAQTANLRTLGIDNFSVNKRI